MLARDRGLSPLQIIAIVVLIMAVLVGVAVYFRHSAVTQQGAARVVVRPVAPDQRAYFQQIEFTEARMSAALNFLGDTVTYLDAKVTNKGSKTVRRLDLELSFIDTLNQVVLRETAHPINARTPPLRAGETRAFRVTLENMPSSWNQAPPAILIVSLEF